MRINGINLSPYSITLSVLRQSQNVNEFITFLEIALCMGADIKCPSDRGLLIRKGDSDFYPLHFPTWRE